MSRLDEIKARAEAATPGPWDVLQYEARTTCDVIGDRIVVTQVRKADAKFIAHARTDNPWLIEQLEAKDAEIERLRKDLTEDLLFRSARRSEMAHAEARNEIERLRGALKDFLPLARAHFDDTSHCWKYNHAIAFEERLRAWEEEALADQGGES